MKDLIEHWISKLLVFLYRHDLFNINNHMRSRFGENGRLLDRDEQYRGWQIMFFKIRFNIFRFSEESYAGKYRPWVDKYFWGLCLKLMDYFYFCYNYGVSSDDKYKSQKDL